MRRMFCEYLQAPGVQEWTALLDWKIRERRYLGHHGSEQSGHKADRQEWDQFKHCSLNSSIVIWRVSVWLEMRGNCGVKMEKGLA